MTGFAKPRANEMGLRRSGVPIRGATIYICPWGGYKDSQGERFYDYEHQEGGRVDSSFDGSSGRDGDQVGDPGRGRGEPGISPRPADAGDIRQGAFVRLAAEGR